jgi:hypothetical protein
MAFIYEGLKHLRAVNALPQVLAPQGGTGWWAPGAREVAAPHTLPVTMAFVYEGLKRLRAVNALCQVQARVKRGEKK